MREQLDSIGLAVGKAATYGGGSSAVIFGMSADTFAALIGAVGMVAGLCIQWYFNRRRDKRQIAAEQRQVEEHTIRMARLRQGLDVPADG